MREATDLKAALDEHAVVAITDPNGQITYVNDKFCAISKYSRKELLRQGQHIFESDHHPQAFFHDLWQKVEQGEVWHGEIQNRAKDGTAYWIDTTVIPFFDDRGKSRQFVAVCEDITEQKRVEAELANKLRLQRLLVELSSRFVALPSEEVDAALEHTLQLTAETLRLDRCTLWQYVEHLHGIVCTHCWQRSGYPLIPEGFSMSQNLPWVQSRVMNGETVCITGTEDLPPEAASDTKTLHRLGLHSKIMIPLIVHGHVFGAFACAAVSVNRKWQPDEITDLKLVTQIIGNVIGRQRAELREEELRAELAHAMRVATLGELAAALAHELNQPLAAILSNAQAALRFIADDNIEPTEMQAILNDIVRDNKRAGNVIHNLRSMASKRPTSREWCSLNELVSEVVELMKGELIGEKIEVCSLLAPALPCVMAARVELVQVLVNLLVNAVHAMKDTPVGKRSLEIETQATLDHVVLRIRDHGHGLPAERLANVFDPFFSTKSDGLGIGLSICRRIIENHSGRIEAQNHANGGACFQFILPTVTV